MDRFRKATPKRRKIIASVAKYNDHRNDLIIDFDNRCGYCNDIDVWRTVWFELDHFVPKKYLKTIKDTDYSNLVYACRSCNNSKRAHWPTGNEFIHNQNNEGFIDPCEDNYDDQFYRCPDGKIMYHTELGKWMYYKLKFHKPQHEIIYRIEQLDSLIEDCENLLSVIDSQILKDRMLILYREYRNYTKQLSSI
ncbi:HNH endonuclease signature motif containing protein [Chryseobacterium shigense]|uniref:5-methylcytosine-specific restriction endonuclease McrA n=1 Tax=Chryseobacterium shigense TaxID=297244 RepID=A0A841NB76_9FLAO|nr:HNH endonuclease signature motif containing protein [Chryseobacterium shigense]MBB6372283.1 5-methylcytosine-specific restriction endonuclease McrA [Chryseobacterium shigense]